MAGHGESAPRPLPTAGGQDDGPRPDLEEPLGGDVGDHLFRRQAHHHGAGDGFHPGVPGHVNEPGRVLGAGHGAAEAQHAEAVVDALVQYAAQDGVPLQQEHPPDARLPSPDRRGQPRRTAADDDKIRSFHTHFTGPFT